MKQLSLVDKLMLLAIDDDKGTFVSDSTVFGYCLAGAVLFELSAKERIKILNETVRIVSNHSLEDETLDFCLDLISNSKKERKLSHWVEAIGRKERDIRKKTLDKLMKLGILELKENKVLWVFTNRKYPTKNEEPEDNIKQRLNEIVTRNARAEVDEIMIISLVDACGLNKEVYGKDVAKRKAKDIKRIIKDYPFADATGKLIKEIHETLMAVLVILIATATITTTS